MPKINVYLPDDLAEAVKASRIPVSAVCQRALEQAVRRVTAIRETALTDDPTAGFTHVTARAKEAIRLARVRAASDGASDGASTVGTGHLLGGMLDEGQNLALHVLRAAEIDPDAVRDALARQAPPAAPGEAGSTAARFATDAANALELTVTEATSLGHNYVGCEHLLLGLIAEPDGPGGHVLRALGAEYRLIRRAVTAALAGYVHLRAQAPAQAAGIAETVRAELAPLVERVERLEARIDPA